MGESNKADTQAFHPEITHVLLSLPILHLIATSVFLAGYCAGFGGQVSAFIQVHDVFRVSISELTWIYMSTLVMNLGGMIVRHASGRPYAVSHLESMAPSPERDDGYRKVARDQKFVGRILTISAVLISAATAIKWAISGELSWVGPWMPSVIVVVLFAYTLGPKVGIYGPQLEVMATVSILLLNALFNGLIDGEFERGFTYAGLENSRAKCGEVVILRGLGDQYLAVTRTGAKVIVDGSCTIRFAVPTPEPKPPFGKLF